MTSADLVTLGPKNAAEMVRPAAGLHRYNACPQLARKLDHSLAAHASPQHHGPAVVQRHDAAAFLPKSIPRTAISMPIPPNRMPEDIMSQGAEEGRAIP